MIGTILLNGILGFAIVVSFLFCIGDVEKALSTDTEYSYIDVFYAATNSRVGASVMAAIPAQIIAVTN